MGMINDSSDERTLTWLLDSLKILPGVRRMRKIESMWVSLESYALDRWYNIDTVSDDLRPKHFDDIGYDPVRYPSLWAVLRNVEVNEDDVFVDIGCGRGRAVCVLATHSIKQSIGVEYQPEHAEAARQNAQTLRRRRTSIEILTGDAGTLRYKIGTIFLLNNPFGEQTMKRFLNVLHSSLKDHPRSIRIVYLRPVQEHVFNRQSWLKRVQSFSIVGERVGHPLRVVEWHSVGDRDGANE
jgi:predicted RNA methylase